MRKHPYISKFSNCNTLPGPEVQGFAHLVLQGPGSAGCPLAGGWCSAYLPAVNPTCRRQFRFRETHLPVVFPRLPHLTVRNGATKCLIAVKATPLTNPSVLLRTNLLYFCCKNHQIFAEMQSTRRQIESYKPNNFIIFTYM